MTEFLLASDLDPATILDRLRSAADAVAGAVRDGGRREPHRGHPEPAAAGDPGPADQRDDPGRGARRLRDGRRRPAGGAVGRADQAAVQRAPGYGGRMERPLRRILGIDLKMKQYAQGSRFVKASWRRRAWPTFNKVWTSPETLPTKDEFVDPAAVAGPGRPRRRAGRRRLTGDGPAPGGRPGPRSRSARVAWRTWNRATWCWPPAPAAPTRWPWPPRWPSRRRGCGCAAAA